MLNIFKKQENTARPTACIFIGKSGCGKGTQVESYIKRLNEINGLKTLHIETGDFLRKYAKKGTYTSELVKNIEESGKLMPESIVIGLWVGYLMDHFTGKENLVFDGAPRRLGEAIMLDSTLDFYNISKYKVVYINVSSEWATARLLARGRKDDSKEGVEKRMAWFEKDVMPCVEFFRSNKNCDFIDVNGEQTIEEVHNEIMKKVFNN